MTVQEKLKELEIRLATTSDPRQQAEMILSVLRDHSITNTNEGAHMIERFAAIAEALDSDEYRAWTFFLQGSISHNKGNFDEALISKNKALGIFTAIGHQPGIAIVSSSIGLLYLVTGRYPEALTSFLSALKMLEDSGDKRGLATTCINIGNTYAYQGNHSMALTYYTDVVPLLQEIGDVSLMAGVYSNMAFLQGQAGDTTGALSSFSSALDMFRQQNDEHGIAVAYIGMASIYHQVGSIDEAFRYFADALELSEKLNNARNKISAWSGLGRCLIPKKDYDTAAMYLTKALKLSEEVGVKEEQKVVLQYLYELRKAEGDAISALDYHERYTGLDKEMTGTETAEKLASLKYNYEIKQKEIEAEISRLRNVELKDALDRLQHEKNRSEELLLNILPTEVAEELKAKGTARARLFDEVTVLFTDFKGFTTASERLSPQDLVDELHSCFKAFDEIISGYNIEKIKTTGDAYLAVSGMPTSNARHAHDIIKAAIEIREYMRLRKEKLGDRTFEVRIGVHSGSVVAGIVGVKKFAYDIWGDTVNTAARMEQNSEAGRINISHTTYELVKNDFTCTPRGKIVAKNKGEIDMYFVE